ncbi:hypothetical protein QAD02_008913, partial [Eretmocerus hayati]
VNLIGEHIDYCGYSVCPMAIEQHVLVAVQKTDDDNALLLTNVDDKYPDYRHEDFREIRSMRLDDHSLGLGWHKYFLCGVKGALSVVSKDLCPRGIRAAVWGNIPPNAGLSSSSALVSAAFLATVHASEHKMSKEDMATVSAKAERFIGTEGGGMDQAIAFLGKAGSAKFIQFNPLRGFDITLPRDAVFVIAHSLADHNKASTSNFNTRVHECNLAAQVIARKRGIMWALVDKLIDVQERLDKKIQDMESIVLEDLNEEVYELSEVWKFICKESGEMLKSIPKSLINTAQKLKLQQRALHVFREANRVMKFREVCECQVMDESEQLRQLGSLMSASHASLKDLYECSHPRIDTLVDTAIECGALGARLTGAGWGGCIVALTTSGKVDEFIQDLKEKFYLKDEKARNLELENLVFKTEPQSGATIYQF